MATDATHTDVKDAAGATKTLNDRQIGRVAQGQGAATTLCTEDKAALDLLHTDLTALQGFVDGLEGLLGALGTTADAAAANGASGSLAAYLRSIKDSATDNTAYSLVKSALGTDGVINGTTLLTPKFAPITASASGDNALVAAVAGKKIRVLSLAIQANGAVNFKFRSAANDKTGLFYQAAAGSGLVLPMNPVGWFETNAAEALNINLSAAVAVGGQLTYVEV